MSWHLIAINLLGGLSIFLFGMNMMSEGINKSSGTGVRNLIRGFTKNRFSALLTGVISTTILQSSSVVSVMAIGFVKARVLKFPPTIGILLGAGIGTTITAQIIAFKIGDYALLIVTLGFLLSVISPKSALSFAGSAILGFGLLFFGLQLMSNAMTPLRTYPPFIDILSTLENPVTGILAGLLFTALIQSSSAFIGIIIVLGSQGLINLETGIVLLLGSNIGTTATAIIASLSSGFESKRVALAFVLIKFTGALLIVWWIPSYAEYIKQFTGAGPNSLPRQIANAHTVFNVFATVLFIPFTNILAKIVCRIVKEKKQDKPSPVKLLYIDTKMLSSPAVALTLAKNETIHLALYVEQILDAISRLFLTKEKIALMDVDKLVEKTTYLHTSIAYYNTQISKQNLPESLSMESFKVLYIISELKEISDELSSTLYPKAADWLLHESDFSPDGKTELLAFFKETKEQFKNIMAAVDVLDKKKALRIKNDHKRIRKMADALKLKHYERISLNIPASIETSSLHMHLMGALRIVNTHLANIARIIIREN